MLVAFDLLVFIITNLFTVLARHLVGCIDCARAFGEIAKEWLLMSAVLTRDHKVPRKWFAVRQGHGCSLVRFCLEK